MINDDDLSIDIYALRAISNRF